MNFKMSCMVVEKTNSVLPIFLNFFNGALVEKIQVGHLISKTANKCLNVREREEVIERNEDCPLLFLAVLRIILANYKLTLIVHKIIAIILFTIIIKNNCRNNIFSFS